VNGPSPRLQVAAVFRKEVRQTVRDRRVMFMVVMAPMVQTILFGFAVDFDVDRVPTQLVDLDRSAESREHARRLLADGTLLGAGVRGSVDEALAEVDAGRAAAALVLPKGMGSDLAARRPAEVQVILDGTDPNRASMVGAAASYRTSRETSATAFSWSTIAGVTRATCCCRGVTYSPSMRATTSG